MKPLLILGLLPFVILAGCRDSARDQAATAAHAAQDACCAAAGAVPDTAGTGHAESGEESIYALDSTWRNQDGQSTALGDLAGRVRVLAMIFTHCQYACPRIIAEMQELEGMLGDLPGPAPGFVLVSFDAERDDPATLKTFAAEQGLDPERWTLLHGEPDAVRELSVVLDVPYRVDADGNFSHASVISVLDREGSLVHQKRGLGGELASCRDAIFATQAQTPAPALP